MSNDIVPDLSDNERLILQNVVLILSSISILGSAIIIFLFWFFKDLRKFHFEVIVWLSVSNLLGNLTYFIPFFTDNYCMIQAYLYNTFKISSVIWSILILYTAIKSISLSKEDMDTNRLKHRIIYILLAFGISSAVSTPIIISKTYGKNGVWCWVDANVLPEYSIKLIFFYYFIIWYLIAICFYLVYQLVITLNTISKYLNTFKFERIINIYTKVKIYPLLLSIFLIPGTVNRLFEIYNGRTFFIIVLIQSVSESCEGIIVALVFLNTPYLREAIKLCINRMFSCSFCRKKKISAQNKIRNYQHIQSVFSLKTRKNNRHMSENDGYEEEDENFPVNRMTYNNFQYRSYSDGDSTINNSLRYE